MVIFHCYVSSPEGIQLASKRSALGLASEDLNDSALSAHMPLSRSGVRELIHLLFKVHIQQTQSSNISCAWDKRVALKAEALDSCQVKSSVRSFHCLDKMRCTCSLLSAWSVLLTSEYLLWVTLVQCNGLHRPILGAPGTWWYFRRAHLFPPGFGTWERKQHRLKRLKLYENLSLSMRNS